MLWETVCASWTPFQLWKWRSQVQGGKQFTILLHPWVCLHCTGSTPLPRSGSNPEHCQKVKKAKLMYWRREALRSAAVSHVLFIAHHCNSHNLTKAAWSFFPKWAVLLISITTSQGLQAAGDSAVPTGQHLHGSALCDLVREKWTEPQRVSQGSKNYRRKQNACSHTGVTVSLRSTVIGWLGEMCLGFHSHTSLQKAHVL